MCACCDKAHWVFPSVYKMCRKIKFVFFPVGQLQSTEVTTLTFKLGISSFCHRMENSDGFNIMFAEVNSWNTAGNYNCAADFLSKFNNESITPKLFFFFFILIPSKLPGIFLENMKTFKRCWKSLRERDVLGEAFWETEHLNTKRKTVAVVVLGIAYLLLPPA